MLHDRDLLPLAIKIVNAHPLGLLTTVDPSGRPWSRWMGSATGGGGLREVYTLSCSAARKIEHLRHNPRVCWVFSGPEQGEVVTLHGLAERVTDPTAVQGVWDRLVDHAQVYCKAGLTNEQHLDMVAILTRVQSLEVIVPRLDIYQPRSIDLPNG